LPLLAEGLWTDHSSLAIRIYSLEKRAVQAQAAGARQQDEERTALISEHVDTEAIFRRALDVELEKIAKFYELKERELLNEVQQLLTEADEFCDQGDPDGLQISEAATEEQHSKSSPNLTGLMRWGNGQEHEDNEYSDDDEEEIGEGARLTRPQWRHMQQSMVSDAPSDMSNRRRLSMVLDEQTLGLFNEKRITLKKRAISLFVALRELKSYAQLNRTGFAKALKKYDKILERNFKNRYMEQRLAPEYCFQKETAKVLDESVAKVEEMYAMLVTGADADLARRELRLHLREHVVWERNTVWRDMIGIERKAYAAHLGLSGTLLGDELEVRRLAGDEAASITSYKVLKTPFGGLAIPNWFFSTKFFILSAIIVLFMVLLQVSIFDTPEQQNCFAMLVFVSLLWATEVSPAPE
jgi:phosphate transporter